MTTAQKIRWETPPPSHKGKGSNRKLSKKARFVEELKKRPGKWAVYRSNATAGSDVTIGKKDYPGTEWTSRRSGNKYTIYARWVG